MITRQSVVRKCSKVGKAALHDLLMVGWARSISKFGKQAFAEELDITTAAVDGHLKSAMPSFDLIVNAYGFDDQILDEVMKELNVRIVPRDATCDTDDLRLLLARVMLKIQEAVHPSSPGGAAIVHQEYLAAEEEMRGLHKLTGDWLQMCADIRKPRSVA